MWIPLASQSFRGQKKNRKEKKRKGKKITPTQTLLAPAKAGPINQQWAQAEARCRQTCVQQDISIGEFHRSLLWLQPRQPPVALETASFLSETTAYWALCWLNKRVCLTAVDSCADRASPLLRGEDLRRSHPSRPSEGPRRNNTITHVQERGVNRLLLCFVMFFCCCCCCRFFGGL